MGPPGLKGIGLGLGSGGKPLMEVAASLHASGGSVGSSSEKPSTGSLQETIERTINQQLNAVSGEFSGGNMTSTPIPAPYRSEPPTSFTQQTDFMSSSLNETSDTNKLGDTIIVRNLPAYMDEQGLKSTFSQHGQIIFSEIRGQGNGIIRYSTDVEAKRCIMMMDRQRLGNNILEVTHYSITSF